MEKDDFATDSSDFVEITQKRLSENSMIIELSGKM